MDVGQRSHECRARVTPAHSIGHPALVYNEDAQSQAIGEEVSPSIAEASTSFTAACGLLNATSDSGRLRWKAIQDHATDYAADSERLRAESRLSFSYGLPGQFWSINVGSVAIQPSQQISGGRIRTP